MHVLTDCLGTILSKTELYDEISTDKGHYRAIGPGKQFKQSRLESEVDAREDDDEFAFAQEQVLREQRLGAFDTFDADEGGTICHRCLASNHLAPRCGKDDLLDY